VAVRNAVYANGTGPKDLSSWFGVSPFNNNQTDHVTARAYNQDFSAEVFTNTATSSGSVDVGPWWLQAVLS
jgi:hypothetical protein